MIRVLEAVPNFSEGRDLEKVRALVGAISAADVEVLDWSADPDHNRCVITFIGDPSTVEEASVVAAAFALEHIDLTSHRGVHPRVGALDVLPFVPLRGVSMAQAVASARRVGARLADMGIPVYFYAQASDPPGRGLAELRRGGFEALREGFPEDRRPDLPPGAVAPHPSAGVTCVGAREVLLAWNVFVSGIDVGEARRIAAKIRERDGGFAGVRALGLRLPQQDLVQVSMNIEDVAATSPLEVYAAIEGEVTRAGGRISGTQVVGMMPDALVLPAAAGRLLVPDLGPARVLSRRVAEHVSRRAGDRPGISDRTG
jgi:glutamate formiminotransferase